jgi:hypothetical protein
VIRARLERVALRRGTAQSRSVQSEGHPHTTRLMLEGRLSFATRCGRYPPRDTAAIVLAVDYRGQSPASETAIQKPSGGRESSPRWFFFAETVSYDLWFEREIASTSVVLYLYDVLVDETMLVLSMVGFRGQKLVASLPNVAWSCSG